MADGRLITWEQAVEQLRDDPAQAELVKACFYDDPLTETAARYAASSEWRALAKLLPAGKGQALDVGAGRGIVSHALASSGWRVTAAEPDPGAIVGAGAIRSLSTLTGVPIEVIECAGEALACDAPTRLSSFIAVPFCIMRQTFPGSAENSLASFRPAACLSRRENLSCRRNWIWPPFSPIIRFTGFLAANMLICFQPTKRLLLKPVCTWSECSIRLRATSTLPGHATRVKAAYRATTRLPDHRLVPMWALALFGYFSNGPGRLYTFVARKPRLSGRRS